MTFWKKIITALTGITLTISMDPFVVHADSQKSSTDFDDFMTNEFVAMMEDDFTTMHFSVSDPAAYTITKPEVSIGTIKDKDEVISENQKSLDSLHEFDYDSLSDTQKVDYKEYEYELKAANAQAEYMDLEMLFEPNNDVTSNIITNMTEFVLRSKDDAADYITVLTTIPAYMDKALTITKEQADKGIFLTDDMLDETEEWIDGFVSKTDNNALIAVYDSRLKAASFLTDEERTTYSAQNKKVVLEQVIPAYQKVRDELEKLRGSRKYGDSVADLPDGEAYYQAALLTKASTTKTTKEILDYSTTYLKEEIKKMALLQASQKSSTDETVSMSTPEEVLSYLQKQLTNEFPALSSFTYHAEYLDKSVATDSIVAYYMQCPVDDATANSIKINGDNISDSNSLYETLAHEGIAGHMYQRNYYMSTNPNPLRLVIGTLGTTEGWAMYAENQMWNYSGLSSASINANQLNTSVNYVLDAVTDLMVNGLGYSDSQVEKYYTDLGISSSYASSIIEYVKEYPLMLVPYGTGLSYYSLLREEAEDSLGSSFNAKDFNTVLLNNGDRNFDLVSAEVESYITGKNGTVASDSPVSSAETSSETSTNKEQPNWILFGAIGGGLAAVGIIALIAGRKYRKDDPFGA